MKIVLQRVSRASITVDGKIVGSINMGYLVLLGRATRIGVLFVDKSMEILR